MTTRSKKALLLALLPVLAGAVLIPALLGAWRDVIHRPEFDAHLQQTESWRALHVEQDRAHIARDSADRVAQKDLLLDVLCATKPTDRRCR